MVVVPTDVVVVVPTTVVVVVKVVEVTVEDEGVEDVVVTPVDVVVAGTVVVVDGNVLHFTQGQSVWQQHGPHGFLSLTYHQYPLLHRPSPQAHGMGLPFTIHCPIGGAVVVVTELVVVEVEDTVVDVPGVVEVVDTGGFLHSFFHLRTGKPQ